MVAAEREQLASQLLGPHHQNPMKLLEVVWRGFCPIIEDKADVNNTIRCDPVRAKEFSPCTSTIHSAVSKDAISRRKGTNYRKHPPRKHPNLKEGRTKPFEIAERPPSDVISISMKMWKELCNHSPKDHQFPGICTGFFSILADHSSYANELPPDGEACSVGTHDSSTVDLSSQCPLHCVHQCCSEKLDDDEDDTDEECLPIAEYHNKKSYRGTQVWAFSLLALFVTFTILRSMNPTGVQFALESKANTTSRAVILGVNRR